MSEDGRVPAQQIDPGAAATGQVPTVQPDGSVTWEDPPSGGGGGGVSFAGYPSLVLAPGFLTSPGTTANPSGQGKAVPITLPGPMRIRGLVIEVTTAGTGTVQWGLFDPSSDATAAVKVAGGSGTGGPSGALLIPAASAPVVVPAGAYVLIIGFPSSGSPNVAVRSTGVTLPWNRVWTTYTWDDTPDLTSASWATSTALMNAYLKGDMNDASATWW